MNNAHFYEGNNFVFEWWMELWVKYIQRSLNLFEHNWSELSSLNNLEVRRAVEGQKIYIPDERKPGFHHVIECLLNAANIIEVCFRHTLAWSMVINNIWGKNVIWLSLSVTWSTCALYLPAIQLELNMFIIKLWFKNGCTLF